MSVTYDVWIFHGKSPTGEDKAGVQFLTDRARKKAREAMEDFFEEVPDSVLENTIWMDRLTLEKMLLMLPQYLMILMDQAAQPGECS